MIHTPTEFVDATPEEEAFLTRFYEEHKGAGLGDVADTVLFEDDDVRIWSLVLEPGQASALHHHACDYYLCISEGDRIAGLNENGSFYVAAIPEAGNTVPVPKGGTEWAVNVGKAVYREILIELKHD